MSERFVVLAMAVLIALAGVTPAVVAADQVTGSPDISLQAPANEVAPGTDVELPVYVSNEGRLQESGPDGLVARVTTARAVRLTARDSETPIEVNTGTYPVGNVPEGTSGPIPLSLTIPEDTPPGTYRIPVRVRYSYAPSVDYGSGTDGPEYRYVDRRETLASVDPPTADADGGVVTDRPTPIVDRDADDAESGVAGDEIDDAEDETDGAEDETDDVDGESGDAAESADASVDPAAVNPGRFPAFVAALFRDHGWSTAVFDGGGDRKYDLIAEADGPVGVTVCVWTAHPDEVEAVDAATIERYAASLDRTEEADVAALVSAAPLSATARERATDHDVRVLDADGIAAECDRCDRDSLPGVPE